MDNLIRELLDLQMEDERCAGANPGNPQQQMQLGMANPNANGNANANATANPNANGHSLANAVAAGTNPNLFPGNYAMDIWSLSKEEEEVFARVSRLYGMWSESTAPSTSQDPPKETRIRRTNWSHAICESENDDEPFSFFSAPTINLPVNGRPNYMPPGGTYEPFGTPLFFEMGSSTSTSSCSSLSEAGTLPLAAALGAPAFEAPYLGAPALEAPAFEAPAPVAAVTAAPTPTPPVVEQPPVPNSSAYDEAFPPLSKRKTKRRNKP